MRARVSEMLYLGNGLKRYAFAYQTITSHLVYIIWYLQVISCFFFFTLNVFENNGIVFDNVVHFYLIQHVIDQCV